MKTYNYDVNNPPHCKNCDKILSHRSANCGAKFCSEDCKNQYSKMLQLERVESVRGRLCEICGKPLSDKQCVASVRTCSAKCAYELRVQLYGAVSDGHPDKFVQYSITNELRNDIDYCKAKSEYFKNIWKNQDFRESVVNRMTQNNPTMNKDVVDKIKNTKKQRGISNIFLGERGGNGHISKHEALLMDFCTNLGFEYNKAISTNSLRKQFPEEHFPTNYKPDFVNTEYKICVEVDGKSHLTKDGKMRDEKKERCLNMLGYKFLRFTNKEIELNIDAIYQQILQSLRNEEYIDG